MKTAKQNRRRKFDADGRRKRPMPMDAAGLRAAARRQAERDRGSRPQKRARRKNR